MTSLLRGKTLIALLAQAGPALPAGSMELCLLPSVIDSAKMFSCVISISQISAFSTHLSGMGFLVRM
jgi:hypothetical protein